jgi:hypothetical protein
LTARITDGRRIRRFLSYAQSTLNARPGAIAVKRAIFDGEALAIKDGRTNFPELQAELASGRQRGMVFYAFGFPIVLLQSASATTLWCLKILRQSSTSPETVPMSATSSGLT